MKDTGVKRIKWIAAGLVLVSVVLIMRLYFIQIVHGSYFEEKADRQYTKKNGEVFDRGSIFFINKDGTEVSAATLKSGFTLAINPMQIEEVEDTFNLISTVYPELDENKFIEKASKKDDPYEELVTKIDEELGEKISALRIPGVILEKEKWRYYPGRNIASQALGFVAFKDDTLTGRYGVERYYNDILDRRKDDAYSNFFLQIFSGLKNAVTSDVMGGAGDLVLTIEPNVNQNFRDIIEKVRGEYSAERAGGIIMDPKNGEILAMVSLPDFDLNDFKNIKDPSVFNNPMVESVYEMGSIIKPLTVASGLDSGAITAKTIYDDKGSITLDKKTFSNYDGKARGIVPMQEVLNQSLNTGVAFIVSKMGNATFADYFRKFGLGEETGVDLPGEVAGLIKNLDSTRDIEYATASFGQGIALSPIATVRALAALGNGGYLVTPHIVKEVKYKNGIKKVTSYEPVPVLKPETSREISRMLTEVVDTALLKGQIKLDHYSVAAKTGTAQIAKESGGGYYEDRYLHSFFGYFPSYEPKFIVFMYLYYPKNVRFASETLTVPFSNVSKYLINYYEVPPDR